MHSSPKTTPVKVNHSTLSAYSKFFQRSWNFGDESDDEEDDQDDYENIIVDVVKKTKISPSKRRAFQGQVIYRWIYLWGFGTANV